MIIKLFVGEDSGGMAWDKKPLNRNPGGSYDGFCMMGDLESHIKKGLGIKKGEMWELEVRRVRRLGHGEYGDYD